MYYDRENVHKDTEANNRKMESMVAIWGSDMIVLSPFSIN